MHFHALLQVLVQAMNPPLDEDGQLLLQQDASTFLKLQYVPGSHQHHGMQFAAAEAMRMAQSDEPAPNGRLLAIHAVGYFMLRCVGLGTAMAQDGSGLETNRVQPCFHLLCAVVCMLQHGRFLWIVGAYRMTVDGHS